MLEYLKEPWPWYVSGPIIGLMVPLAFIIANKRFGVSSSLRHICAACMPAKIEFFKYNWKDELWNLFFVGGILLGGAISRVFLTDNVTIDITQGTVNQLKTLGIDDFTGYMPEDIFSWNNLLSLQGVLFVMVGGFMVGFGARWAGGCTSGHSITGISTLQWVSLVATISFFIGGLFITHVIYPILL